MQAHSRAAVSFGEWPRALTARRILVFTDPIAFVVQTTPRIEVVCRARATFYARTALVTGSLTTISTACSGIFALCPCPVR